MRYSDKLNGFWEEGYHYYLEFRDERLIVRGYDRSVTLETTVSYDADRLEAGERTVITLADNVLSRTWEGKMMTEIKELAYENGELKFLYYYTIMGETLYTLKKTDHGPFSHIIIRDEEFMDKLQGRWERWSQSGNSSEPMIIEGNKISWAGGGGHFHVVSYTYDRQSVYIVPESLTRDDFGAFTKVSVLPDKLTATMMVCDMSMPLSVFARKDMLDKIDIPAAAKQPARSTMTAMPMVGVAGVTNAPGAMTMGMMGLGMIGLANVVREQEKASAQTKPAADSDSSGLSKFCTFCGYRFDGGTQKFCPECGGKREKP